MEIKDFLVEIFNVKDKFERQYYDLDGMSSEERENLSQKIVTMIIVECSEFLRELNYKLLPTEEVIIDKKKLLEELMDIGHFYIFLCLVWGLDGNKFYEEFMKKNAIVCKRAFILNEEE